MFAKLDKEMVAELKWVNGNNEGTTRLSELISLSREWKNMRSNEEGRRVGDALPTH